MRHKCIIAAAIGAILIGSGIAVASIPDSSGVIHACLKDAKLRVIDSDAGQTCLPSEQALNWSQAGPQGPAGPQGLAGPAGTSGYERVVRQFHVDTPSNSAIDFALAGPVSCPTGKHAVDAGLVNLDADQAWNDAVASDPSGVMENVSATVGPQSANNGGPSGPDFLRDPVPATGGQTADATGWTLRLQGIRWPTWHGNQYGFTANLWLACMTAS
jgi:hypothetical protein